MGPAYIQRKSLVISHDFVQLDFLTIFFMYVSYLLYLCYQTYTCYIFLSNIYIYLDSYFEKNFVTFELHLTFNILNI